MQPCSLTIKTVGDYTRDLYHELKPGGPPKLAGPFGGFAIWIAGGIGITPFISWTRSLDGSFDRDVDFYYFVAHDRDAIYLDEIQDAARQHP